jgi:hypothetical protein
MIVIKNGLNFLVIQATTQYIIYALMIQSVIDNKVVLSLILYVSSILSRKMMRELQDLKIDQNDSIPGV